MCNNAGADPHSKAWLYRGMSHHYEAGSDASSQDMYVGTAAFFLAAPSKAAVAQLNSSSQGPQLLQAMRSLASQLLAQSTLWPSAAASRGMLDVLQELHSWIVSQDDALDEQRISAGVAAQLDECRQWLKQTQGFVLQLTKQVQGFADDVQQQQPLLHSTEALSSMEEGCSTSSTSSASASGAPSSAASLGAWRSMCQDATDVLTAVVEQMAAGGAADGQAPAGSGRPGGSRLVAQTSRLSYATHWSKKVAI